MRSNLNVPYSLILPAPAKINLFLRILQRRADGYHNLQTAFQFLDWCDSLQFTRREDEKITLKCNLPELNHVDNLIIRAAEALRAESGVHYGCDIVCEKSLPLGSGLGGGSSNAATTLLALNILWGCQFSLQQLAVIGLRLGADVPIFVAGVASWAEGVGELLTPMHNLPTPWCVILNPNTPMSTAEMFAHPALLCHQNPYPLGEIPANHHNDFQSLACTLYPEIDQALQWLSQFKTAWLTGSGCAIVSAFETRAAAEDVVAQIPSPWSGRVAQTCNTSPLLTALNAL